MKFTDEWLREYCPHQLTPDRIEALLTGAGIKVEAITEVGADRCFELELTANRPDGLSLIGVGRELALACGSSLREPSLRQSAHTVAQHSALPIEVADPERCPRYTGRVIRGVRIGPSPGWLERRLTGIGLRSVNNVVDITNYVLFECGQPLHAFDLARLHGPALNIRRARKGEKIVAIDEREYALDDEMLVIADRDRPVAVAGVMGGKDSEVSSATVDLLLESAYFHPHTIRRTSRRLALSSASSYRFERGVDPERVVWASRRATDLILELAGGRCDGEIVDRSVMKPEPRSVTLRLTRLGHVLGVAIPAATTLRILTGLGLQPQETAPGTFRVQVPSYRVDLAIEEDLIEEVARVHGYDQIPTSPRLGLAVVRETAIDHVRRAARASWIGCGYREVLTNSFAEAAEAEDFPWWSPAPALACLNPQGGVERTLRRSLIPSMLKIAALHEPEPRDAGAGFEIARAYLRTTAGDPADLALVAAFDRQGFHALKGGWEVLMERLGLAGAWSAKAEDLTGLYPGRSVRLLLDGESVGVLGEVTPEVMSRYGLRQPVAVLEARFDRLVERANLERKLRNFSRFPEVTRDLALVVKDEIRWETVERLVRTAGVQHLELVSFFDLYRGKGIAAGEKSLAFRLTFRAEDRTLTGDEIDLQMKNLVEKLVRELGARQR